MKRSVWIVAGGTGGHISPGLALGSSCTDAGYDVSFLSLEKNRSYPDFVDGEVLVHFYGAPSLGGGIVSTILFPPRLVGAAVIAAGMFRKSRPDAVIGMGGFSMVPALLAAFVLGIPVYLCEQNAVPGKATLLCSRFSRNVFLNFPLTSARSIRNASIVGNPVRPGVVQKRPRDSGVLADLAGSFRRLTGVEALRILVLGGSQGAVQLNDMASSAVGMIPNSVWAIQCGKGHSEATEARIATEDRERVKILEFSKDMASLYSGADLVICRAGAGVLSEVTAYGLPSILVPYPYAADNHQLENARYLAANGAAVVLDTKERDGAILARAVEAMQNDKELMRRMGQRSLDLAKPWAGRDIAARIMVDLDARRPE